MGVKAILLDSNAMPLNLGARVHYSTALANGHVRRGAGTIVELTPYGAVTIRVDAPEPVLNAGGQKVGEISRLSFLSAPALGGQEAGARWIDTLRLDGVSSMSDRP